MHLLKDWLDSLAKRLCEWLNDFFPGDHGLAVLGDGIAGAGGMLLLPVDRRLASNILQMAHQNGGAMQGKTSARGGLPASEQACNFWAYCHMNGQPCVWCSGKNSLTADSKYWSFGKGTPTATDLCPSGKTPLNAWYGCCKDPTGKFILIAFTDCCGAGFCKNPTTRCKNWPEAKNWCVYANPRSSSLQTDMTGTNSYYCTVAINMGESCS